MHHYLMALPYHKRVMRYCTRVNGRHSLGCGVCPHVADVMITPSPSFLPIPQVKAGREMLESGRRPQIRMNSRFPGLLL